MTNTTIARRLLGQRADGTPIWLHAGADTWNNFTVEPDEGGDGDEPDDEGDEPDDDDQDGKAGGDWTPPSQQEWDKTQAAIRRNNAENKKHRLLAKQLATKGIDVSTDEGRQALDDLLAGKAPADTSDGASRREVQRQVERATAKVETKYKGALARTAAKAALTDAGWSGKNMDRALNMIDLELVEVDDDGNVTGIDDQVAEIKADIPEWFKGAGSGAPAGPPRRGASEVDGGDKKTKAGGNVGWLQQVDRQMAGGR